MHQARGGVMSPAHDRMMVCGGFSADGRRPVLAVPSGATAFMLTNFKNPDGADFTADGTQLGVHMWWSFQDIAQSWRYDLPTP